MTIETPTELMRWESSPYLVMGMDQMGPAQASRLSGRGTGAGDVLATADLRSAALQRQLANDEPKCANCQYWRLLTDGRTTSESHGECLRCGSIMLPGYKPITTDLSVCSRWEAKG